MPNSIRTVRKDHKDDAKIGIAAKRHKKRKKKTETNSHAKPQRRKGKAHLEQGLTEGTQVSVASLSSYLKPLCWEIVAKMSENVDAIGDEAAVHRE